MIADCDQLLKLNPKNYKAYDLRGEAKYAMGDGDGAIMDFDHSLELVPDARAYSGRALARRKKGDVDGAAADEAQAKALAAKAESEKNQ